MSARSLSTRLIAGTLLWLVAGLGAGGVALSYAFRETVEVGFARHLDSLLLALVAASEVDAQGAIHLARPLGDARFEQVYSGWYWQIEAPDGTVLLRSRSLWDEPLAPGVRPRGPRGEPLRLLTRTVTLPRRDDPVTLRIAVAERELTAEIARFDRLLLVSLGLLGLGLATSVLVQVRFGLRPLRRLAADLGRVRAGEQSRLPDDYPREIAPLAAAMNDLLAHDAALIARARTHVGNLAHALKTPLAVLHTELARGREADLARMRSEVSAMTRLTQHHLARAAAAGAPADRSAQTPIAPVTTAIRDGIARIYAARELAIAVDVGAEALFRGERQDLEEMLGNLVDNAAKFAAGRVCIRTAKGGTGWCRIEVEDDGPGLHEPAGAVQRGVRLDTTVPGDGLGLAIARDLAELYGGTLDLDRSALGGLRARLTLPGHA